MAVDIRGVPGISIATETPVDVSPDPGVDSLWTALDLHPKLSRGPLYLFSQN